MAFVAFSSVKGDNVSDIALMGGVRDVFYSAYRNNQPIVDLSTSDSSNASTTSAADEPEMETSLRVFHLSVLLLALLLSAIAIVIVALIIRRMRKRSRRREEERNKINQCNSIANDYYTPGGWPSHHSPVFTIESLKLPHQPTNFNQGTLNLTVQAQPETVVLPAGGKKSTLIRKLSSIRSAAVHFKRPRRSGKDLASMPPEQQEQIRRQLSQIYVY